MPGDRQPSTLEALAAQPLQHSLWDGGRLHELLIALLCWSLSALVVESPIRWG